MLRNRLSISDMVMAPFNIVSGAIMAQFRKLRQSGGVVHRQGRTLSIPQRLSEWECRWNEPIGG